MTVRSQAGARSGIKARCVLDEDLKAALVCVLGIVGAEAVPTRKAQQTGGITLDDLNDEFVKLCL